MSLTTGKEEHFGVSPHRLGKPLFPPASLKHASSNKPEVPAKVYEFVYKHYLAKFLFKCTIPVIPRLQIQAKLPYLWKCIPPFLLQ